MAIKMRNNTKSDAICCECNNNQKQVLNMFDLCIGDMIFTICDECNSKVFAKVLRAESYTNSRLKSQQDMMIIAERRRRRRNGKN